MRVTPLNHVWERRRVNVLALTAAAALCGLLSGAVCAPHAGAQSADTLMPEASTAKAKQNLDQLITALGGPTYTDIRDSD